MRIEDVLLVNDSNDDRSYTADQIIAVLDGGAHASRATITATYQSASWDPTVYYTALNTDGSTLTARTTSGVTQDATTGLWKYTQATTSITDFIAMWDEGDVNDYVAEWIVVDT